MPTAKRCIYPTMPLPGRGLRVAFGFLTRWPVAVGAVGDAELASALPFFPLVGFAVGGIGVLVALAGGHSLLAAVAVVALQALATGGLHLDGVADLFDALGGGRGERERTLAILRDSHIGAHGAAALLLLLLAKTFAIQPLLDRPAVLLAAPLVARWAAVGLVVLFPAARRDGLGHGFRQAAGRVHFVLATAMAIGLLVALGIAALPGVAIATAVAFASALAIGLGMHRRLGGLTGDVDGAAVEVAELAYLVVSGHLLPHG